MANLSEILRRSRRTVCLTGAGVSTGSGIPDFRSAEGLYASDFDGLSAEQILSRSFFLMETEAFFRFYRERMLFPAARPNAIHRWLARLERQGKLAGLVTQNIDGLHRDAGNRLLYELHGSVRRNECMDCGAVYDAAFVLNSAGIPRCPACGGVVKPDVVLYGEPLNEYVRRGARREIGACDTLLVMGTSLRVEPAASLLDGFQGRDLVILNREATPADSRATLLLRGDIAAQLRAALEDFDPPAD